MTARHRDEADRRKKSNVRAASQSIIRLAAPRDIPALVAIENRAFMGDWVSPRGFHHLLTRGNAATLVETEAGELRGYALVRFRRGSRLARLYSFAVAHEHRGQGIAKALLAAAERVARKRGCVAMRLEVRQDNQGAQALYRKAGYREFGVVPDYYNDHMAAIRMERPLRS